MGKTFRNLTTGLISIIVFVVMISCLQIISFAWEGDGSKENPYLIYSLEDLEQMSDRVNHWEWVNELQGCHFKLMNDITMNEPDVFIYDDNGFVNGIAEGKTPYEWEPIGTGKEFSGFFDGDNHVIKGIYVNII